MKAGVLQASGGEPLSGRSVARATKRARGAESDIVEQDDEDVGGASRRAQLADRRELRIRILGIVGRQADRLAVRNWEHVTREIILACHLLLQFRVRDVAVTSSSRG